jgi:prephenate dehydratase
VSFQGWPGAFSEEAAIKLLGSVIELVPCATFTDLFQSLDKRLADYALAPVENTLVGSIQSCLDLLDQSDLVIQDEVTIQVAQHLIGCAGVSVEGIESVESHPVALAQCEGFFTAHPHIKRIPADDTAGSVARVMASANCQRAAIAGRRAAERYGGSIIQENVQDRADNFTRFLLLALPSSLQNRVSNSTESLSGGPERIENHHQSTQEGQRS